MNFHACNKLQQTIALKNLIVALNFKKSPLWESKFGHF